MTTHAMPLTAVDLFVLLERAFRRKRGCRACAFTLPFRTGDKRGASWAVIPSTTCSEGCRLFLEQLVAEHQEAYRLVD